MKRIIISFLLGFFIGFFLSYLPYLRKPSFDGYVKVYDYEIYEDSIILLTEEGEIRIYMHETQIFSIKHAKEKWIRPLSHDLIENILKDLNAEVIAVSIDDLKDGIYYAKLYLKVGYGIREYDCRPSDCIALALRYDAPIYVKESLLYSPIPQSIPA